MTCIVGVEDGGHVWIGGDSAGVSNHTNLTVRADDKVFVRDQVFGSGAVSERWVFGFTSSFRMGQLLHHRLTMPQLPPRSVDLAAFMATTFVDAVRACLREGGWLQKQHDREDGGTFVVGVRGALYIVHDDFQVAQADDPFVAVGCGANLALGAMFVTADLEPEARIGLALAAAERFSAGVRSPFKVRSTHAP